MPGPAPKPTALRELAGNPGHRPLNKREPRFAAGVPTRPEWLLPEAKREWARIVPELLRLQLLAMVDRAALANYCQWWARYVEAEKILSAQGLTILCPSGYMQQRPEVAIAQKAAQLMKAFLVEFGLTPASRSRVSVPEPKQEDEFSKFLRAKVVGE
jgi:P27 family predicted phage terminase small subunit